MNNPTKYLALALCSTTLVACGGGGGGDSESNPVDSYVPPPSISAISPELAKYVGVWRQACDDHKLLTTTLTADATNDNFTVMPIETHFAYKDCTGDVVAIGSYGVPSETVKYSADLNASVTLTDGTTIPAIVNAATSSVATATFTFTGSGVGSIVNINGTNYTQIQYADVFVNGVLAPSLIKERTLNGGTTYGALLLRNEDLPNEELLTLIPVTDAPDYAFKVNLQFFKNLP